jgi:hypothetical protein
MIELFNLFLLLKGQFVERMYSFETFCGVPLDCTESCKLG